MKSEFSLTLSKMLMFLKFFPETKLLENVEDFAKSTKMCYYHLLTTFLTLKLTEIR